MGVSAATTTVTDEELEAALSEMERRERICVELDALIAESERATFELVTGTVWIGRVAPHDMIGGRLLLVDVEYAKVGVPPPFDQKVIVYADQIAWCWPIAPGRTDAGVRTLREHPD
jgi:hypothetical protein